VAGKAVRTGEEGREENWGREGRNKRREGGEEI